MTEEQAISLVDAYESICDTFLIIEDNGPSFSGKDYDSLRVYCGEARESLRKLVVGMVAEQGIYLNAADSHGPFWTIDARDGVADGVKVAWTNEDSLDGRAG